MDKKQTQQTQSTIITLWFLFLHYGEYVRSNKMDGLEAWSKVKKITEKYINKILFKWTSKLLFVYQILKSLGVTGDDDDIKNETWAPNHFLLQLGRIVKNNINDPEIIRLLQIAYNLGQLKICIDQEKFPYTFEQLTFYKENNLKDLLSYFDKTECDFDEISKRIPIELIEEIQKIFPNDQFDDL